MFKCKMLLKWMHDLLLNLGLRKRVVDIYPIVDRYDPCDLCTFFSLAFVVMHFSKWFNNSLLFKYIYDYLKGQFKREKTATGCMM